MPREVVVTGIGLVSSLGEGAEPHLAAMAADAGPSFDAERFAPYPVHPAVSLDWSSQIPKKVDQRQMEPWQKLGVYAAGLALDGAGLKDDAEAKSRLHLIVAAGGGERDYAVDGQILTGLRDAAEPGAYLNERLLGDLRPTLFLAQLSNMLAGNIAIVHGVTGASRTFMGEESCGTDALRIAAARIAAGQAEAVLVGGSYNAERPDGLLTFALGDCLWGGPERRVFDRHREGGGLVLGSGGAFLLLESRDAAEARGARALARLLPVGSVRAGDAPGAVETALDGLFTEGPVPDDAALLSAASGVAPRTAAEREALARLAPGRPMLATGDLVGHLSEAAAPVAAALAALLVAEGRAPAAAATIVGHRRGAGLVRVVRAD